MNNEAPMWALSNRFDALGVRDYHCSPLFQNSQQLAEAMFKDCVHHSPNTMPLAWESINRTLYYVDQLAMYASDKAGATRRCAEYDAAFWRRYRELLEREMNRIPTAEEQEATDALNELAADMH